jgi:hypothetical protein
MTHQNYTIPLNGKNLLLEALPTSQIKTITRVNSTVKDLFIYLYDLSPLELDLLFILIKKELWIWDTFYNASYISIAAALFWYNKFSVVAVIDDANGRSK